MSGAVILSAVRTAIGTARKGALARTSAESLACAIVSAAVRRAAVAPEMVDDVILAESLQGGGAIARHAAIRAGLTGAGGMAVNRHCAGGLAAIGAAAGSVLCGAERFVVAGGVCSISTLPEMRRIDPLTGVAQDGWMPDTHPDSPDAPAADMSITVGWNTAREADLSREDMDRWALRSHQRAVAAITAGRFVAEIEPVAAVTAAGETVPFAEDEHPRRDSSMERLASLKALHPEIEGFSITAGNAAGLNDGASAVMVASETAARDAGVDPIARIRAWTMIGVDPRLTGLAAIEVIRKLLARTGVAQSNVALWEINEAFAAVPVAACKLLGLDPETVNVSGSGCSLGHPIAATGGRMVTTLVNDLRRRGGGLGIAAMCAGGGQAGALLIEV